MGPGARGRGCMTSGMLMWDRWRACAVSIASSRCLWVPLLLVLLVLLLVPLLLVLRSGPAALGLWQSFTTSTSPARTHALPPPTRLPLSRPHQPPLLPPSPQLLVLVLVLPWALLLTPLWVRSCTTTRLPLRLRPRSLHSGAQATPLPPQAPPQLLLLALRLRLWLRPLRAQAC